MKNIFDYSHVKSVSAIILLNSKTKALAGKIIANWSDNPNGPVCTAQVIIYSPSEYGLTEKTEKGTTHFTREMDLSVIAIGKAGECGYDKLSTAIENAMHRGFVDWSPAKSFASVGASGTCEYFASIGLDYVSIV